MKLDEIQTYFEPTLFEMSNFQSTTTGLPSGIKLWVREEPTGLPHTKYRIKISHPQHGSAVFALWGGNHNKWLEIGKWVEKIY